MFFRSERHFSAYGRHIRLYDKCILPMQDDITIPTVYLHHTAI